MEKINWNDRVSNEEVIQSQRGKEYPTDHKKKEGYLDWSYLKYKLLLKHLMEGKIDGRV